MKLPSLLHKTKFNKKAIIVSSISVASSITFSGIGVCIGYAVWHHSNPKIDESMETILNDPRYDVNAFNDFFTWEYLGAFGENPAEPPVDKENDWSSCRYQLNIAGTRIRNKNEFSWFRKNMVASPLLGIEPQFNTSAYGNFESENTHDIDDENVMDAFSYSYYKTPLSFIDGTYVRDTLDYPSLFPFIFNTFNQDENTKKITDYAYVQYVNVSPSIWYSSGLFRTDLLTIYHIDNRALFSNKNNTIRHSYQIDITALMETPVAFTLGFQGRTWDLLLQGIDGGIDNGLTVQLTSVDGTTLDLDKVWDTNNHLLHLSLNQWFNNRRKYKIYMSWAHTV